MSATLVAVWDGEASPVGTLGATVSLVPQVPSSEYQPQLGQ